MEQYLNQNAGAKLVIMDGDSFSVFSLEERTEWMLGREQGKTSPENLIPLHSPIVSRYHAHLRKNNDAWYYIDNPANKNGTIYNGTKMTPSGNCPVAAKLFEGDILRIDNTVGDNSNANAVLMFFTSVSVEDNWKCYPIQDKQTVRIGRSPDSDIVQKMPYLSAKHAQITRENGAYYLSDCGSKAGTYRNHERVTKPVRLRDKDCFNLADRVFFLSANSIYFMADRMITTAQNNTRPVILRANIKSKRVKNLNGPGMRELIRDVQLEIKEGTLIAMLGTAGAGKTTVMNCLNGMDLQGVEGSVVYRNVELMQNYNQMKSLIGSVPQQKIFHKTFTPEQEFYFAARKRLPGDTTNQEIQNRVDKTLKMLSIQGVRKSQNSKLSGGEQTRVNVGIELVADRDLLCLDEPDQGLSPNYKHELFEILQRLAHESGKTMLCIIHDVSEIDMFDQIIMLVKKDGVGRLAFSGTPQEARNHFGVDIRDVYALLDKHPERYVR